jgi:DNA transposition AAA+ family ATPase
MPDFLFADEERKLFYQGKFLSYESEDFIQASQDLKRKLTYDYMKVEDRFKLFEIEYTKEHEEVIFESVITARGYLNNLHQQYLDRVKFNNSLITNGLPI